jgi:hypothetical protein
LGRALRSGRTDVGCDRGQPQWTHVMIKGTEPRTSRVMLGVLRGERDQTIGKVLKPAWRSGPVVIRPAFVAARPRAGLAGPPPGPPEPTPPTRAWWHPAAAVGGPPGCRRGGRPRRAVVPPRRASGRHLQDRGRTCCSARWRRWGTASPTAASSAPWTTCAAGFPRWSAPARRCALTGWRPGCSDPEAGPTRRCCTTPSGTPLRA